MAPDFIRYLLQYLSPWGIGAAALVFLLSLAAWEIPRLFRTLDEDVLKGAYPEHGKAVDIALFVLGLASLVFLELNMQKVAHLIYKPGFDLLLAAGLFALPIVFLLGFAGRAINRMDGKHEAPHFLAHTALDFVHTVFYICFAGLALPAAALLLASFV